jgi:hypothetical protein
MYISIKKIFNFKCGGGKVIMAAKSGHIYHVYVRSAVVPKVSNMGR